MGTNLSQEFNTEARAFCLEQADKVAKECKECGGRGRIPFGPPRNFMWDVVYAQKPCPSCTPEADKWRKLAEGFCNHEPPCWYLDFTKDPPVPYPCKHCGAKIDMWQVISGIDSTYDNPADIAAALKRMGLWERFVEWLIAKYPEVKSDGTMKGELTANGQTGANGLRLLEIATDPALFIEAGTNFLREVRELEGRDG